MDLAQLITLLFGSGTVILAVDGLIGIKTGKPGAKLKFWIGTILTVIVLLYCVIVNVIPESVNTETSGGTYTDEQHDDISEGDDLSETIELSNGTYTGEVSPSMQPDGYGTMIYKNLDEYTGDWVNGRQNGKGKMIYANKDTYDGEWKDGKKHGQGKYTWSDGRYYEGEYQNDKRYHYGKYSGWKGVYYNGIEWEGTYEGEHVDDVFQGEGRFYFSNGDTFIGFFNEDKIWNGTLTQNGKSITIENGKPAS